MRTAKPNPQRRAVPVSYQARVRCPAWQVLRAPPAERNGAQIEWPAAVRPGVGLRRAGCMPVEVRIRGETIQTRHRLLDIGPSAPELSALLAGARIRLDVDNLHLGETVEPLVYPPNWGSVSGI